MQRFVSKNTSSDVVVANEMATQEPSFSAEVSMRMRAGASYDRATRETTHRRANEQPFVMKDEYARKKRA